MISDFLIEAFKWVFHDPSLQCFFFLLLVGYGLYCWTCSCASTFRRSWNSIHNHLSVISTSLEVLACSNVPYSSPSSSSLSVSPSSTNLPPLKVQDLGVTPSSSSDIPVHVHAPSMPTTTSSSFSFPPQVASSWSSSNPMEWMMFASQDQHSCHVHQPDLNISPFAGPGTADCGLYPPIPFHVSHPGHYHFAAPAHQSPLIPQTRFPFSRPGNDPGNVTFNHKNFCAAVPTRDMSNDLYAVPSYPAFPSVPSGPSDGSTSLRPFIGTVVGPQHQPILNCLNRWGGVPDLGLNTPSATNFTAPRPQTPLPHQKRTPRWTFKEPSIGGLCRHVKQRGGQLSPIERTLNLPLATQTTPPVPPPQNAVTPTSFFCPTSDPAPATPANCITPPLSPSPSIRSATPSPSSSASHEETQTSTSGDCGEVDQSNQEVTEESFYNLPSSSSSL